MSTDRLTPSEIRTASFLVANFFGFLIAGTAAIVLAATGRDALPILLIAAAFAWGGICGLTADW